MLPPQLRSGTGVSKYRLASSSALRAAGIVTVRASTAHMQSRGFFRGRRRCWDWTSQLDPAYQRYARVHTIKSRAKLLKSLRRRSALEWDADSKPFFTPRNLRWASHWKGRQWYTNDDPKEKINEEASATKEQKQAEEDGYELSRREKEWKEQMEAMRKRIREDPYEAIFGKRFEPFWSPLVPSWMREEMGLQDWPRDKEANKAGPSMDGNPKDVEEINRRNLAEQQERLRASFSNLDKTREELQRNMATAIKAELVGSKPQKPFSRMTRDEKRQHVVETTAKQRAPDPANVDPLMPPSSSYSYASSTTWNSVSNKTKKMEWDSNSNQTKTFEYDPISNRMVEIASPNKVAIDSDSSAVRQSVGVPKSSARETNTEPSKAVDIPVKQSNDIRKSVPIPPPLSQPSHSITLGYMETSVGPSKSTAVSSASIKPAALAKLPPQDLDLLTADNVRASMGKVKASPKGATAEEKADLERDFDAKVRANDAEVDAILKERATGKQQTDAGSAWDRAEMEDILRREMDSLHKKKEKLLNDEKGLFHIERQKRELMKADERLKALDERLKIMHASIVDASKPSALRTALQRQEARKENPPLQSSIERMQSKELPAVLEQDLDDAAAHESTEPVDSGASVPREWSKAADLLQADRVKRTTSKRAYPMTRWVDDMNARKVAYEQRKAESQAAEDAKNAESNAKLEKLNTMLQAEVAEQKVRMQAFEGRYAQKVKSLRGELDVAFKQSSVHAEKHLDRIRELEAQLSGLKEKELKYADKVKSLRDELERAYKQSAVHAEKHLERIRYLESELETATRAPTATAKSDVDVMPAEGDICVNAPSFSDNGKWYKRPANVSDAMRADMEKAERRVRDHALAEEVQEIYEREYGAIDENHEQPQVRSKSQGKMAAKAERKTERRARKAEQAEDRARQVVEVESDVDLGEELAKYENENPEAYKVEEALSTPESAEKMKGVIADSLEQGLKLSEQDAKTALDFGIQWADPPLYKVLAYDSGNDMMSNATTTISVLPGSAEERPLGIPEALSQLYQPARFVPYFAELQSDNFQAIAATRDVIVFRQLKPREQSKSAGPILEDHGLQGLKKRRDNEIEQTNGQPVGAKIGSSMAKRNTALSKDKATSSTLNPIDGTSRLHLEPTTGNFASPTGFVNHDPVFPPDRKEAQLGMDEHEAYHEPRSDTYSTIAKASTDKTSRQIYETLPGSNQAPVKRQEPVFSGMTRKERQRYAKEQQQLSHERGRLRNMQKQEQRERERERERAEAEAEQARQDEQAEKAEKFSGQSGRRPSVLGYILGAGAGAAGAAYLVATLTERTRQPDSRSEPLSRERVQHLQQERQRLEDEAARLTREWERR